VANKAPPKREAKKPKKNVKVNAIAKEAPAPMAVEVVKRKRKERVEEES
jgi:hypothetical protein